MSARASFSTMNKNKYKIESGIRMPNPERNRTDWKYPFQEMKLRDSFFISDKESGPDKVKGILARAHRRLAKIKSTRRFAVRHLEEQKGSRIWRVK